jgi:ADP-ribosylglycohydrolase
VAAVAAGGWQHIPEAPATLAGGDVLAALQLLLGGLARGTGYRDTVLAVVNLGLDADANGALVGQFAGGLYGADSLPAHWIADLAGAGRIAAIADRLLVAALARIVAP